MTMHGKRGQGARRPRGEPRNDEQRSTRLSGASATTHSLLGEVLSRGQVAGLVVVFLWFFIGGILHFVATDTEARIVPPWFPWPVAAVLVSGVFELLGAAGILRASTRRQAGIGLFLLTLAVTPAHVYMLQRPELFPVPLWALWLRLPVQAALLWLILWCTWRPRAR